MVRKTRQEFYESMEELATSTPGDVASTLGEIEFHLRMAMRDAAATGYRQAYQEILGSLRPLQNNPHDLASLCIRHVEELAASRGLDLTEGDR